MNPRYRTLLVLAMGITAWSASAPLRAQIAARQIRLRAKAAMRGLAQSLPDARLPGAQAVSVRGPILTLLNNGEAAFIDHNNDGEFGALDMFIGNGSLQDDRGRDWGTWEGTVIDSSPSTYFINVTLRLTGIGTVTLNGAGYGDGTRSGLASVPIVGRTGRARYPGPAGVGLDDDGNLVIAVGGVQ